MRARYGGSRDQKTLDRDRPDARGAERGKSGSGFKEEIWKKSIRRRSSLLRSERSEIMFVKSAQAVTAADAAAIKSTQC